MNELQRWGMASRDGKKLFTIGNGPFGHSITEYKLVNEGSEKATYNQTGFTIHKNYEQVFDRMMHLLQVDKSGDGY